MTVTDTELAEAVDRLSKYNLDVYSDDNLFGLSGRGGMDANWEMHSADISTVGAALGERVGLAVAAATAAATSATNAGTSAGIATAKANEAAESADAAQQAAANAAEVTEGKADGDLSNVNNAAFAAKAAAAGLTGGGAVSLTRHYLSL